jgi:hypothetical protein
MGVEGIESAILRLRSGGVRYRGVLVVGGEGEGREVGMFRTKERHGDGLWI